ncbi:flagellin [Frigidibacter sp. ROC022]|uniref:flagellin n=1 Tax=Frigidibacter sp. ROC022 TaxID=2971796 RepID=UPI00215A3589|nr:flagellin [Frigidibacter sp. ROC022]MCR8724348.1 flagellin [Frigidibacter sp. ROC022]
MAMTSIGDQSQLYLTRTQTLRLKTDLTRLSQELASGRRSRPATATTGDTAHLLTIERGLTALAGFRTATAEAGAFAAATQTALESVQTGLSALAPELISTANSANPSQIASKSADARGQFGSVVALLNGQSGGRALFAGTATDRQPLAGSEAMLAQLTAAIAGETTASGIESIVDDWFMTAGGGFETLGYKGGGGAPSFRVAEGEDVSTSVNAADPAVREILKGHALAALVSSPALAGNVAEQVALMQRAGEVLAGAETGLTRIRATLGDTEARIDALTTRQSAERTALQLAEAKFTSADPYETASALQEVSTQLETLYAVTARLSRLNLAEYLR